MAEIVRFVITFNPLQAALVFSTANGSDEGYI